VRKAILLLCILEGNGLPKDEAIALMSAAGDLEICQVVDPLKTARFKMPKSILKALDVTGGLGL
jgi:amidase